MAGAALMHSPVHRRKKGVGGRGDGGGDFDEVWHTLAKDGGGVMPGEWRVGAGYLNAM